MASSSVSVDPGATAPVAGEGQPERSTAERLVQVAAALSVAAALIHASVSPAHFAEYWLFGLFFVGAAIFQLVWGGLAWTRLEDRRLLWIGAIANLAIILLWAWTRTAGLPIGPDRGEVEVAGFHDLFACAAELGIVVAAGLALSDPFKGSSRGGWLVTTLWVLAVLSGISALVGGHSA